MKNKVALIIVFNHKYNKNINTLRDIYRGRFTNVFFLVPFYEGDEPDIIPVYENSYYFQGYLAQGFKTYFDKTFEHYFFVADDMILNPKINEDNYKDFFGLHNNQNFIPQIFTLDNFEQNHTFNFKQHIVNGKKKNYWWRNLQLVSFSLNHKGLETQNEIPTYEEAKDILKRKGYEFKPLSHTDIYGGDFPTTQIADRIKSKIRKLYNSLKRSKTYPLSYPLVGSYSDIVIVNNATIKSFIHFCGVFAANRIFVEFALPTALVLSSDKLITEIDINKRGILYWNDSDKDRIDYTKDMESYNYEISKLLEKFPADKLYMHPVKLSKWKS